MTDDLSAAADFATGVIVSRAVEPGAGEGKSSAPICLNCDAILSHNHCAVCGQKAKVHRSLSAFWHDILHSVLHFDGKIWRTLPLLAWYPGELTRRYVHGERAKFVSPIAMFLFCVFLSFAVFSWLVPATVSLNNRPPASAQEAVNALAKDRAEIVADIKELTAERRNALTKNEPTSWIDAELVRENELLARLDAEKIPQVKKQLIAERKLLVERRKTEMQLAKLNGSLSAAQKAGAPTQAIVEEIESEKAGLKLLETANAVLAGDYSKPNIDIDFLGSETLNAAALEAVKNPQLLLFKIQSNAYKYSWALIPISTPFLWLLFFWRREYQIFDHAVFITYSLCFMMVLAIVGALSLRVASEGSFLFVVTILSLLMVPPIHIYRQIHRAYLTSRWEAAWRTGLLTFFALLALLLFTMMIITLGVTG